MGTKYEFPDSRSFRFQNYLKLFSLRIFNLTLYLDLHDKIYVRQ
jgi:hypothetical protein